MVLDSLDPTMAEVVEDGLRALVQAREERPCCRDRGPHAIFPEGWAGRRSDAVEAPGPGIPRVYAVEEHVSQQVGCHVLDGVEEGGPLLGIEGRSQEVDIHGVAAMAGSGRRLLSDFSQPGC